MIFRSILAILATNCVVIGTRTPLDYTTISPSSEPVNYLLTDEDNELPRYDNEVEIEDFEGPWQGENWSPSPRYSPPVGAVDECSRICDEYSADRQGNGHDLCENGGNSDCYYSTEIDDHVCRNLYWSVDESGTRGLIFEMDPATLTSEESPLLCIVADQLIGNLQGRVELLVEDHLPEDYRPLNNLNMALHMFVNSAPVQRRLGAGARNQSSDVAWFAINQFANNNTNISEQIIDHVPHYERDSAAAIFSSLVAGTNMLSSFVVTMSRINTCGSCGVSLPESHTGHIPIVITERNNTTVGLVERLRALSATPLAVDILACPACENTGENFNLAPFFINSTSEMLALYIVGPEASIALPINLNLTDIFAHHSNSSLPMYRLYGFASDNNNATFRIADEWFVSNNGTTPARIAPLTDPVAPQSVRDDSGLLVLYERV